MNEQLRTQRLREESSTGARPLDRAASDMSQEIDSDMRQDIETFYQGPSGIELAQAPPKERWLNWSELDSKAWPRKVERRWMLIPTTCFNCESACGLLAYVDPETEKIRKLEGNPEHPGSRGRNCAKGPATLNQLEDPDRILYPLKRSGPRGSGKFERVSWDEVLSDLASRIRKAIEEDRRNQIMIHIGRPGEDGFTERVLASWGVDGHNSHTNVCSSGGRAGYHYWMGIDRPSPDYANAKVIFLISSHLETGHYFNPHAQRITEARAKGAKVIVLDTRLSNTATHADYWLAPWPGSEPAICLAIANYLISNRLYDEEFVRRWWNWEEYMNAVHPDRPATFEAFQEVLEGLYASYDFDFAAKESGIDAKILEEVAEVVSSAGTAFAAHNWRSAAAGNLGGWQVSRSLFMISALLGAIATKGGTFPNAWNKFVPRPPYVPPEPEQWNELTWPIEYPLAMNEMSFLLPHLLQEQRGRLEVYFTRVYNPVWTNPDGFSWIEMLMDQSKVGCYVALTPTWNETSYFADYVLPMGHATERHDLASYEQYDGQWIAFRQPVIRTLRELKGEKVTDTRQVNPGEVWEENEFWIELSWRIDPDGSLGIRRYYESPQRPGEKMTVDDYYSWIFENSVPGLPEAAAKEGLTPLEYMRRYGAFEIKTKVGKLHEETLAPERLQDMARGNFGRIYSAGETPPSVAESSTSQDGSLEQRSYANLAPTGSPEPDELGRKPVGVEIDGVIRKGFPTPSGKLEFYSSTLASWGWPEVAVPTYLKSHVHREELQEDQLVLIPTFRLPTQIHTRSANSKWLDELAHHNPVWIHPKDAEPRGLQTGDLLRVVTEIGYFVGKAWVTEGIRPGVIACSHHMGRWKLGDTGPRLISSTVQLDRDGTTVSIRPRSGAKPFDSEDPDTRRIWWVELGVHQNLTFPVHPDPVSGMHCWHQAVRVEPARPGDRPGDVSADVHLAHEAFKRWLALTKPAYEVSPDGTRRPRWLMRPLKPSKQASLLPGVTTGDSEQAPTPSMATPMGPGGAVPMGPGGAAPMGPGGDGQGAS